MKKAIKIAAPEALARLRTEAENRFHSVEIQAEDLRAMLDAYDEALERLSPFAHCECDGSGAGYVCGCEQCLAFRFLKKSGRR